MGVLRAGVTHRVLLCNDFKTLFAIRPFSPLRAAMRRRQATAGPRSRRHGMTAPCGHAMTGGFAAEASIHEAESCTGPDSDHVHPHRDRSCWCKTELNQQLWLLPAIGADQEHCSVVL